MQRYKALSARPSNTSKSSFTLLHPCMTATSSHKANIFDQGKKQIWWPVIQEIYQSVDNYREAVAQQIA